MKHKKRKIKWIILILILLFFILVLSVFLLFQTKKITIEGNQYCKDEELVSWIQEDKYAINSAYIWWRYNQSDVGKPAAIESVKVSLKNPWTVVVKVTEKTFLGYFDYQGEFLYFDDTGTAALKSTDVIPGAPLIEGLDIDESKVKMNEALPVSDEGIFDKIVEVTRLLNKYELSSDKLSAADGSITLYFGGITVQLGSGSYEQKVAQISPILQKLDEQFAGKTGVLHLENYESLNSTIRFVPDDAGQDGENGEKGGDGEDTGSGENSGDGGDTGNSENTTGDGGTDQTNTWDDSGSYGTDQTYSYDGSGTYE